MLAANKEVFWKWVLVGWNAWCFIAYSTYIISSDECQNNTPHLILSRLVCCQNSPDLLRHDRSGPLDPWRYAVVSGTKLSVADPLSCNPWGWGGGGSPCIEPSGTSCYGGPLPASYGGASMCVSTAPPHRIWQQEPLAPAAVSEPVRRETNTAANGHCA